MRLCGVLNLVADQGPMSQQAIGEQLGIDRTTMVELVDELERLGSARRERNARDRRSYSITLTPQGNLHQRRAFQAFDAATEEFFAPLSADERETFADMLKRLIVTS